MENAKQPNLPQIIEKNRNRTIRTLGIILKKGEDFQMLTFGYCSRLFASGDFSSNILKKAFAEMFISQ